MSSTSPSFLACLARTCLPVSIRSSALATPDEARQALGTAGARQQAELHFRQAQHGFAVIGHHPAMAGERQLQPAAGQGPWMAAITGIPRVSISANTSCPARESDSASWALVQAASMAMSAPATKESFLPETITRPIRSPFPAPRPAGADLVRKGGLQGVHALTGHIHGEDADAVFANFQGKVFSFIIPPPAPWPPPAHPPHRRC